eukprot:4734553-Pleurochrysis_carterae.AAC.3
MAQFQAHQQLSPKACNDIELARGKGGMPQSIVCAALSRVPSIGHCAHSGGAQFSNGEWRGDHAMPHAVRARGLTRP